MAEQVGGIFYDVSLETKRLLQDEQKVGRTLGRLGDEGDKLQAKFSKVAAAITAALGAIAIEGLVSKIVTAQRSFDVMFASLKTMTGGVDQAGAAWERLQKFAAKTPFTLEQSVQGFVKLKALGLDPGERAMTSYGNTAAAMGKNLSQMIEAVADASTGEFERLKEFGIKARVEGDKVALTFRGLTTSVQNDAASITDYLIKIGETDFAGAMSERMKTLDGDISNLQDTLAALYLTISQSGFGDAVAAGVRKATEAIAEASASIKRGGLTDYFEGLVPYINAAELAATTLAAVVAGRLVAAFVAAAAQAYTAAAGIGAATLAARGFVGVLTLLGGPIGIAVTGLALLALNWDKIAGSARDAATVSEDAARRIEGALKKGPRRATEDLNGQLADYQAELGKARQAVVNLKVGTYGKGNARDIAEAEDRVDAFAQAVKRTEAALASLHGGAGRGSINPPMIVPDEAGGPKPGRTAKPSKASAFDSAGYLAGLAAQVADEYEKIDIAEREALRKNDEHLKAKQLNVDEHMRAVTMIEEKAAQARAELASRAADADIQIAADRADGIEAETRRAAEAQKRQAEQAAAYAGGLTSAVNPIDALRQEYEAKLSLVTQYEQLMAQAGVDATEQGQAARAQIEGQYTIQRQALAEQSFRAQGDANAFLIDSLNAFNTSATSAIVGLINQTMSAQDAMRALAGTILNEAVGALVQIGVQQIKNALLGKTLDAADKAQKAGKGALYTASISAQVAGMTALAAQNAFAATAAIPIIGPGLAPAAAAAAAAAAAGLGAAAVTTAPIAGARQYGGPVSAGSLYRVNEGGRPEMYTASNGSQYMMPTKSGNVTPAGQVGGGSPQWSIIINNAPPGTTATVDQQARTVTVAVAEVANQIANNSGPVFAALRGATNVRGAGL